MIVHGAQLKIVVRRGEFMVNKVLVSLVIVTLVATISMASPETVFTGTAAWSSTSNWLDGAIPATGWIAYVNGAASVCTVESGYSAVTGAMQIAAGKLVVDSGGNLNVDGSTPGNWSEYNGMVLPLWSAGPSEFVNYGTTTITGDLQVYAGVGTITVNDGLVSVSGMLKLPGWWNGNAHMIINGGTVSVDGLVMQPQSGNATDPATSSIDIKGGKLIIRNTRGYGAITQTYVNVNEIFTSLPGYHIQIGLENGATVVTAVPEPITVSLLGLGGLLIARRSRK